MQGNCTPLYDLAVSLLVFPVLLFALAWMVGFISREVALIESGFYNDLIRKGNLREMRRLQWRHFLNGPLPMMVGRPFDPDLSPEDEYNQEAARQHCVRWDPKRGYYVKLGGTPVYDKFGQPL